MMKTAVSSQPTSAGSMTRISTATSIWRRTVGLVMAIVMLVAISVAGIHPAFAADGTSQPEEVRVVGRLPLKLSPAEQDEFQRRTLELAKVTRAKDAVTSYSCNADIEQVGTYVFDEIWPSEQALRDHLDTAHFKAWWDWVEPHLNGDLVIKVAPTQDFHTFS